MSDLQGVLAARVILFAQVSKEPFPVGDGRETEAELVDDPIPRQDVLLGLPQRRLLLLQLLLRHDQHSTLNFGLSDGHLFRVTINFYVCYSFFSDATLQRMRFRRLWHQR